MAKGEVFKREILCYVDDRAPERSVRRLTFRVTRTHDSDLPVTKSDDNDLPSDDEKRR